MRLFFLLLVLASPLWANPLGPQSTLILSIEGCDAGQLQSMVD